MPATALLVHGAWHGAWCWDPVVALLREREVPVAAVDLPLAGLERDVAAVRGALDEIDGEVVLVGHSYGGAVVGVAGAGHAGVRHLVYVAAFVLDVGESVVSVAGAGSGAEPSELAGALRPQGDGTVTVDPSLATGAFYATSPPELAAAAVTRLRPMPFKGLTDPVGAAAWRDVPSTYVLCTNDRAVPPSSQRSMSARCGRVVELPTDHSPFLSAPAALAELLAELSG